IIDIIVASLKDKFLVEAKGSRFRHVVLSKELWPTIDVVVGLFIKGIHNAYAVRETVEWRRNSLTPIQIKVAEHMCKKLNIECQIVEPSGIIYQWRGNSGQRIRYNPNRLSI
ncbi:3713_t:CDS:2, partial [Funneliformis mosseae]